MTDLGLPPVRLESCQINQFLKKEIDSQHQEATGSHQKTPGGHRDPRRVPGGPRRLPEALEGLQEVSGKP